MDKSGSNILSLTFVNNISWVFNRRVADNNLSINIEGRNTSVLHDINKVGDCNNTLKPLRKDNINKLIFAHLNTNSIWNKFELFSQQIKGKVDVLIISETKIDDTSPIGQFLIEGFCTPYRIDRNSKGGGILLYVREDITSNLITGKMNPIESFYVE